MSVLDAEVQVLVNLKLSTVLIAIGWIGILLGAIVGTPFAAELFVCTQVLFLAVCISLAFMEGPRVRPQCAAFSIGFMSWILLLQCERYFSDAQVFRDTLPGSAIRAIAAVLGDIRNIADNAERFDHYARIAVVLRYAFAVSFGLATAALTSKFVTDHARPEAKI